MGIDRETEKEFLYWLLRCPGIGPVRAKRIVREAGSWRNAYYIEGIELKRRGILTKEELWVGFDLWKKEFYRLKEEMHRLREEGILFLTPMDPEYPPGFAELSDAPLELYVKGSLPNPERCAAAIVGARACSPYGEQVARRISRELAEAGVEIISGLALGIDAAGHQGALDGGGRTFAVLGCGVNICYPKSNFRLYEQILEQGGGILSEYPPGTAPASGNFPIRNRIISALSEVILVMEARKRSGSLITAEIGLEQGKDIFALPGRVTDSLSQGCNQLIEDGAFILTSADRILEFLGVSYKKSEKQDGKKHKGLAKREKMVYSCLDSAPVHLEEIAAKTGLSVSQSMEILLELELGGYAVRTSGLYYTRGIFAES